MTAQLGHSCGAGGVGQGPELVINSVLHTMGILFSFLSDLVVYQLLATGELGPELL